MTKEINDSAYWREFERNELTHSAAHYLMAIDSLREELGYARVTDVAEKLDVSRGAASTKIADLKKRGWVSEDPKRIGLLLADEGEAIVNRVEHNFRILAKFFSGILGLPKDTASADACKLEHLMSAETAQRVLGLMHFLEADKDRMEEYRSFMLSGDHLCKDVESCPICEDECLAAANISGEKEDQSV